ncbi:MAG: stage III sporulation protein AG [Acutalibacteraceae bacterium]
MREILGRLRDRLSEGKAQKWIVAAGVLGMALILLSEFWPSSQPAGAAPSADVDDYAVRLEERLTGLIETVAGAGKCRVLVTLENGVQYVYATQQRANSQSTEDTGDVSSRISRQDDTEESVILVESADRGREGLLVTAIEPTVKGVVVVCEGGDDEQVREQIERVVTTALNVSARRVCVGKLDEQKGATS